MNRWAHSRALRHWLAWLPAILLGWASTAQAHKASDSYLRLVAAAAIVQGQWDIALRDLDMVLALDANGDGQLSWGEVRGRQGAISQYAFGRLKLGAAAAPCAPRLQQLLIDRHSDGAYAVLRFEAACAQSTSTLRVEYHLFADVDSQHRGLVSMALNGRTQSLVLGPDAPTVELRATDAGRWRQFAEYLRTGVDHIWSGYDHILFLVSLLLPAVLLRRERQWVAQHSLRAAFVDVCKVVTAFTVAHSVTLSLAAFDIVHLPSRLAESAIALSVVLAAINNVVPLVQGRRWLVAFGFGLIHGFGFANVLTELGLPAGAQALALLGFNIGVEAGQLAIVAVFLPCAFLLRDTLLYRRVLLASGSLAVAAVAAAWLAERALNLQFMPMH